MSQQFGTQHLRGAIATCRLTTRLRRLTGPVCLVRDDQHDLDRLA